MSEEFEPCAFCGNQWCKAVDKCLMREWIDRECDRILGMSDAEVMKEHLALYDGNQQLADASITRLRNILMDAQAKNTRH